MDGSRSQYENRPERWPWNFRNPGGSGFFSRNDQRAALWEVTMGIAPVKGRLRHLVKVGQPDPPVISNWRQIKD